MHHDRVNALAFLMLPSYSLDFNDVMSDFLSMKSCRILTF